MRSSVDSPIWSPDGLRVAYVDWADTAFELLITSSSGAEEEVVLFSSPGYIATEDWSTNGQLTFSEQVPETGHDIWTILADGSGEPHAVLRTPAQEAGGSFSPDGRFLAFESDKSGRFELYVMSFPDAKQMWQLTNEGLGGVGGAVWSVDGSEIGFLAADGAGLIAWTISIQQQGRELDFGPPRPYLGGRDLSDTVAGAFTQDLDRMLLAVEDEPSASVDLTLLLDWQDLLKD